MEMHQVRYFLGVARNLNFTRAAEACHVSQPSLTRAIKLLEEELGGDLFRRERNLSHLTDLGQRMLPLLQQCFDSAQGVKALATSIKKGEVATLRLALSRSIDMALVLPLLTELMRTTNGLDLKFLRGTATEVSEILKKGDADLAVAGPLEEMWDRLDAQALFIEGFQLAVSEKHRLSGSQEVSLSDIRGERILARSYCEIADTIATKLGSAPGGHTHTVTSERDLLALLEGNVGIAIVPRSTTLSATLRRIPVTDLELTRSVHLYSVAGRPRALPAATFMRQLQAADWSRQTP